MSAKILLVGISGGSGSGKTTFSHQLRDRLGIDRCAILAQDDYYIDQSAKFTGDGENVNFDHPDSLDFTLLAEHLRQLRGERTVEVPSYDFVTHQRLLITTPLLPLPVILVDGTLILSQPPIRECLDYSFFIETPEQVRFDRRFARDVAERGRKPEGVRKQFSLQVKPMHDQFIETSKRFAREIVSGLEPFDHAVEEWLKKSGLA